MQQANIAIIGGTGFEALPPEIFAERIDVATDCGPARVLSVSDNYTEPHKLYFLSRHGAEHGLAPHQINYRANTLALRNLGVRYVFATNAAGSLRSDWPPGTFVVLDDFIDFTKQRPLALHGDREWSHVDFTTPYSPLLRRTLVESAGALGVPAQDGGTYVCCEGPRFESPAEVRLFRNLGGDLVCMTGLPEATFAREAGIEYAAIAIITNLGAGMGSGPVDHAEVVLNMTAALPLLRDICLNSARRLVSAWHP